MPRRTTACTEELTPGMSSPLNVYMTISRPWGTAWMTMRRMSVAATARMRLEAGAGRGGGVSSRRVLGELRGVAGGGLGPPIRGPREMGEAVERPKEME